MNRPLLYVDIETYSTTDLKAYGAYPYAADPNFLILMAAWARSDEPGRPVRVAFGDEIAKIPGLFDPRVAKVAHNAQFERVCFSRLAGLPAGEYLDPEEYVDTAALAAAAGYPRSLERCARALGGEQKDSAGTRLINVFCVPDKRTGRRTLPREQPDKWLEFIAYCRQDVFTLIDLADKLPELTPAETELFHTDQRINDRGIKVDTQMARMAAKAAVRNRIDHRAEALAIAGIENANSPKQMLDWLKGTGLRIKDLKAETVERQLQRIDLKPEQRRVLELRQELALSASAKFNVAVGAETAGRLRGQFTYHGAHTGRWSGRGVQLHNLPRLRFDTDSEASVAITELLLGLDVDSETLKKLIRPMLVGPFTVVDFSAIEARVIAWLAGETWALKAFAAGRDIYVETAERMGGLTRAQGKVAVLALGFGGGAGALVRMGADDDEPFLLRMRDDWRAANRRIVQFWYDLENAFKHGGRAGRIKIRKQGRDRHMVLPSGREIVYHDVRMIQIDPENPSRTAPSYLDPVRGRHHTYGGRLGENATQAVARDVLGAAIVRLESRGYPVVAHIHDEVLVDGAYPPEEIANVMCELPDWAEGLPMNAEGYQCARYRKD